MKDGSKRTVEDYLNIDSRTMARSHGFTDGSTGTWAWRNGEGQVISSMGYTYSNNTLTFQYFIHDKYAEQSIKVTTTSCNYGKFRHWFLCPGDGCNKRVAKLYLVDGVFHCRHCHKLNYLIQQCNKEHVARINMQRMRIKLGWPLDRDQVPFINKISKPLNKHRRTFKAMVEKHNTYERKANAAAMAMHNALMDKLDDLYEKTKHMYPE